VSTAGTVKKKEKKMYLKPVREILNAKIYRKVTVKNLTFILGLKLNLFTDNDG